MQHKQPRIRQHTSAYVTLELCHLSLAYASTRQHTSHSSSSSATTASQLLPIEGHMQHMLLKRQKATFQYSLKLFHTRGLGCKEFGELAGGPCEETAACYHNTACKQLLVWFASNNVAGPVFIAHLSAYGLIC